MSGTQTIARALALLRTLATGPRQGWRLVDLANACGLDASTTHRILKQLVSERLIVRDGARRYLPGPMLFELGLAYPKPVALIEASRPSLAAVAREFGAVGTLWLRSGPDVVCADRVGRTSTQVFVQVGTRRPLASMAPGISILLGLKTAERRPLMTENQRRIELLFPGRQREFRAMLERSERAGYGITLGDVTPGIYAVGASMAAPGHPPVAAIALIGRTADVPGRRLEALASRLDAAAKGIAHQASDLLAALA